MSLGCAEHFSIVSVILRSRDSSIARLRHGTTGRSAEEPADRISGSQHRRN
jgi:hypothetical protein